KLVRGGPEGGHALVQVGRLAGLLEPDDQRVAEADQDGGPLPRAGRRGRLGLPERVDRLIQALGVTVMLEPAGQRGSQVGEAEDLVRAGGPGLDDRIPSGRDRLIEIGLLPGPAEHLGERAAARPPRPACADPGAAWIPPTAPRRGSTRPPGGGWDPLPPLRAAAWRSPRPGGPAHPCACAARSARWPAGSGCPRWALHRPAAGSW